MTRRLIPLLTAVFAAVLLVIVFISMPQRTKAALWQDKVDPWVLETAASNNDTQFFLYLTEQADLSGAESFQTKEEKGQYVFEQLTAVAAKTQPAVIQDLENLGADYQPFWVANMIWVQGDEVVLAQLARREDVAHVYANPEVYAPEPETSLLPPNPNEAAIVEWNVAKIGAPEVWTAGVAGQTIVVGGQDTGYQWDHPAIKSQYRGWDGATANHNYNWHDAIHNADNSRCPKDSPAPCDDNSHGTHTMGTMVGDDGSTNQIGVAPGAQWIGCRNMNAGVGTPATYAECYQWFIAPTDLNGENPDPGKAPHVINNSWSCPVSEGCTDPNVLLSVVEAVRAAGIVTVHSAGNSGSSCGSVSTAAAIYDESFTVGNTTSTDAIAFSSSRGPVIVDGSNRLKPDVSAPGTNVRSSVPTYNSSSPFGYSIKTGTSMAGPHVAGQVALLLSAQPGLIGDVDAIEEIIRETAVHLTTTQDCGTVSGMTVPNNTYGYGRIDALAMVKNVAVVAQGQVDPFSFPGDVITYSLTVTNSFLSMTTQQILLTNTLPAAVDFITATMPFTQDGDTIRWSWSSLAPGETQTVKIVAQVPGDVTESPLVDRFDVSSNAIAKISGELETAVLYIKKYFPFFVHEP